MLTRGQGVWVQDIEGNNIILVLDERQTGLGRTGKLLAEEHEGIEADLTLIGKALSAVTTLYQPSYPTRLFSACSNRVSMAQLLAVTRLPVPLH